MNTAVNHKQFYFKVIVKLFLFFLFGAALSTAAFLNYKEAGEIAFESLLERKITERILTIQRSFDLSLLAVESTQSFMAVSGDVDYSTFKQFVSPLISKLPGIKAIEWIPRIKHAEVEFFVKKIKQDGFPEFYLSERNALGDLVNVSTRNEYYPVYFIEPMKGNEKAHGYDLASNKQRLNALTVAKDKGSSVATERIRLVQSDISGYGFLIFSPVYGKLFNNTNLVAERKQSIRGFALGVFDFKEILEKSITIFDDDHIHFQLFDITDPNNKQLLFNNLPEHGGFYPNQNNTFSFDKSFEFLGRSWLVSYFVSKAYAAQNVYDFSYFVLFIGLLITLVLTYVFYKQMDETYRINKLVAEKTVDLNLTNQRLTLALNNAQLGLWDWDIKHNVFSYSSQWLNMLGYEDSSIRHTFSFWKNIIHPNDLTYFEKRLDEHLNAISDLFRIEYRLKTASGQWKWVLAAAKVSARDENCNPIRMTGINLDLDFQKKHEAELESAKIVAENANKAKTEFLASMSHEFRTPLNAIIGFSEFLMSDEEEPLNEYQKESVSLILNAGNQLLCLVDDILDLSALENDSVNITLESIETKELIAKINTLIASKAHAKSIKLINKVTDEPSLKIRADYQKVKQVLLNLASNAVKFNYEGGHVVFLCTQTDDKKVRISLVDTGPGVPQSSIPKMFEPFDRLSYSCSNIEGVGVGLSVCKSLVEQMGGKIGVFNNPDKGMTFWVEFDLG